MGMWSGSRGVQSALVAILVSGCAGLDVASTTTGVTAFLGSSGAVIISATDTADPQSISTAPSVPDITNTSGFVSNTPALTTEASRTAVTTRSDTGSEIGSAIKSETFLFSETSAGGVVVAGSTFTIPLSGTTTLTDGEGATLLLGPLGIVEDTTTILPPDAATTLVAEGYTLTFNELPTPLATGVTST